jgi:hypothetical protein
MASAIHGEAVAAATRIVANTPAVITYVVRPDPICQPKPTP